LSEIVGHIALDDDEVASRFGESLLDHVDLLRRFPHIGNITPGRPLVRRLVHSPILVYYQVDEEKRLVEVLHYLTRIAETAEILTYAAPPI
jgi:plasmid stabilization system protein ParE